MTKLAILVNSPPSGVLAPRARAFASGLASEFTTEVVWRETDRLRAIPAFVRDLRRIQPDIVYLIDLGYPAVLASLVYRATRTFAFVIETGDPLAELLMATGRVGRMGRLAVRKYEQSVLGRADQVVVRGSGLIEYVAGLGVRKIHTVTDGVDIELFRPMQVGELRRALGMEGLVSIGVMGTLNWSKRLQWGYGAELIEVLTLLKDLPICGIVLGDGPGRGILERRAAKRGLRDRIRFVGHVPYEALPPYINAIDICLSTQTNDSVGRARTTAKLPLFLACGRFVLASRVGAAARVLPEEMLVEYCEGFDDTYSERLARRIEQVVKEPQLLHLGAGNRRIAESQFDYGVLIPRIAGVLRSVLNSRASHQ